MKKVGIITYHASHNYGSMLQAYALQHVLSDIGLSSEIINFRTAKQKDFYRPPFQKGRIYRRLYRVLRYRKHIRSLLRRHELFERFMTENMVLSAEEYNTFGQLAAAGLGYDVFISGSDQIWNVRCFDFDPAYFLRFTSGCRKVAYAPSMGPLPDIEDEDYEFIATAVRDYDYVSVREQQTADVIRRITGKDVCVMPDPTLLMPPERWYAMAGEEPLIKGDYIFLYSPSYRPSVFRQAKLLSGMSRIKVVVPMTYGKGRDSWMDDPVFYPYLEAGPSEFLNLCRYARYVVGASFHLAVFALFFHKPLWSEEPLADARIRNLMQITGNSLKSDAPVRFNCIPEGYDFSRTDSLMRKEREKGIMWLSEACQV